MYVTTFTGSYSDTQVCQNNDVLPPAHLPFLPTRHCSWPSRVRSGIPIGYSQDQDADAGAVHGAAALLRDHGARGRGAGPLQASVPS